MARRRRRAHHARVEPAGVLPRGALRYLRAKGLRTSDHWTDVWREEHATAFTAARLTQESLVAEVHRELVQALRAGETMETFRARIQPWLERRGWRPPRRGGDVPARLARIYRTNMRTAQAAGRWERILRRRALMPYLVYERSTAAERRPAHAAWVGLILPVDSPWWNTHYPPNGWGCRCRVRQITERERSRLVSRDPARYRTTAPEAESYTWVNPGTGEERRVAEGVDPGWDYNPGAHRTLGVHRALIGNAESMVSRPAGRAVARERIHGYLRGPGFRWFATRPRAARAPRWDSTAGAEAVPVAVLPDTAPPALLSAGRRVLRLKEPVMDKQWRKHGPGRRGRRARGDNETPYEWYADIQAMIDAITPWEQRRRDADTGREIVRWVYERPDGRMVRRLVLGLDEDDGVPIVYTLHPRKRAPGKEEAAPT